MPYPIACRPTPSLVSPSSLCDRREGTDELCARLHLTRFSEFFAHGQRTSRVVPGRIAALAGAERALLDGRHCGG